MDGPRLTMELTYYQDLADELGLMPFYGMRLIVGLDSDGEPTIVASHTGDITSATLIGVLEVLKHRILEA